MGTDKKKKAERRGRNAEKIARIYLRLKGYRILSSRYKTKMGEIDIVATRGNYIVFIEVKARANLDTALDSIAYKQRRRIEKAASLWLKQHRDETCSPRFDVIALAPGRWPRHIKSAWRYGE